MLNRIEDIELNNFIKEYDACFLEKDIEKLKLFYPDENNELVYFDNHKKNDTYSVDDHLNLLRQRGTYPDWHLFIAYIKHMWYNLTG